MSESSSASSGSRVRNSDNKRASSFTKPPSFSQRSVLAAGSSTRPSNPAQSLFANRDDIRQSSPTGSTRSTSRPAHLYRPSAEPPNIQRHSPQTKRSPSLDIDTIPGSLPVDAVKPSPGCLGCLSRPARRGRTSSRIGESTRGSSPVDTVKRSSGSFKAQPRSNQPRQTRPEAAEATVTSSLRRTSPPPAETNPTVKK